MRGTNIFQLQMKRRKFVLSCQSLIVKRTISLNQNHCKQSSKTVKNSLKNMLYL